MGGGNGQAFARGEQQPQGGRQQRGHHDIDKLHRLQIDRVQIDDAFADGIGYFAAGNHRAADLEHRRNQQCLRDGQRARTDAGTE